MIRRAPSAPLGAALQAAVQAALDERREVCSDPAVERALIARPESLGPLLVWLAALAEIEHDAPALPGPRRLALATAAGLAAAAGLLLMATRLSGPLQGRASDPHTRAPALLVHDFSITVTHQGPAGTTRSVNDNGRVTRVAEWTSTALAQVPELPPAVHALKTHVRRRNHLR